MQQDTLYAILHHTFLWLILNFRETALTEQRTAIVLIHGIGDQERCSAMHEFLRTFSRLNLAPPCRQQVLREPGNADDDFAYFTADSRLADRPIKIAEFYWADLSRIQSGFLSILVNFFRFVVDAPDIIYACLAPRSADGEPRDFVLLRCLRSLLALAMWFIYFPIIAINMAYAVIVSGFAVHARLADGVTPGTQADQTFAVTAAIASVVLLYLVMRRVFSRNFETLALLALLILYAVLCLSLYNLFITGNVLTYRQYAGFFNGFLNLLWAFVQVSSLIYLLSLPILLFVFWRRWRAILLGFATTFLVIRFWLLFITTLWLIFLTSIFDEKVFDSLLTDIGGPILFISLFWFDIAIIGLSQITPLVIHFFRSAANSGTSTTKTRYPRLIVPIGVPLLTVALAIAGIATMGYCGTYCPKLPGQVCSCCCFVYGPSEWILVNAGMLLVIGGIIIQMAHSQFEVVLDIVNYFKSDRGHHRINPVEAMSSVFWYVTEDAVEFRPRLKHRLKALIADLNRNFGTFDRTIFVAHSLGSMFAIEVLRDWHIQGKKTGRLDLITMGSPYTAVFNHFFPHMFAKANAGLLPNVTTWTNIYRENDYVGKELSDGRSGIEEIVQPPLGHEGYLRCDSVVTEIVKRVVGREGLELTDPAPRCDGPPR